MRTNRIALLLVAAAIVAIVAGSAAWVVGDAHRALVAQVEASERLAVTERADVLAAALAPLGPGVQVRPHPGRHDGDVLVDGIPTGQTIQHLSSYFLLPLPALQATTSLVTRDGRVLVSNSTVTSPRVKATEVLRLLARGRVAGASYHSPVLDSDRIGVVAPVAGTDLMVVVGADASFANRPASALSRRLIAGFALTLAIVGLLATLFLLLLRRVRRRLTAERDLAATLATTDALTQLGNRRGFEEAVAELGASERRVAVVAVDMDGLKAINDLLGHEAGDEALRRTAAAMHGSIRPGDLLFRTGGDEFVLLLAGATADDAAVVSRRMAEAVSAVALPDHGALVVSTGCAAGPGLRIADVLWEADVDMYRTKRAHKERAASHV